MSRTLAGKKSQTRLWSATSPRWLFDNNILWKINDDKRPDNRINVGNVLFCEPQICWHVYLCSVFILWHRCTYTLVGLMLKIPLFRVQKSKFPLNISGFCWHKHDWKMTPDSLNYSAVSHFNKCWKTDSNSADWPGSFLTCNSTCWHKSQVINM